MLNALKGKREKFLLLHKTEKDMIKSSAKRKPVIQVKVS